MVPYCCVTYVETLSDNPVGESLTDQANNLVLALSKGGNAHYVDFCFRRILLNHFLENPCYHRPVKPNFPFVYLPNGFNKRFRRLVLRDYANDAEAHRSTVMLYVRCVAKQDNPRPWRDRM